MLYYNQSRILYTFLIALFFSARLCSHNLVDVNVGYPKNHGPIPETPECLFPQLILGQTTTLFVGAAAEPTLAVNPRNPEHIVCAWQQDRISNGGGLEAGIAYSQNGGKTWCRTEVPFQSCIGGIIQRVSDVWLSFAADGKKVYLSALALNATIDPTTANQQGIVVTTSVNGGRSWSKPLFVASSDWSLNSPPNAPVDDKNSITADPNNSRFAYLVWDRVPNSNSFHSDTLFSHTTNNGSTWSPQRVIYNPFPDLTAQGLSNGIENDCQTIDNVVVVLPKAKKNNSYDANGNLRCSGDLLNFMVRIYATPNATDAEFINDQNSFTALPKQFILFDIAYIRSKDRGKTWDQNAQVITSTLAPLVYTGGYSYNAAGEVTGGIGTLMRTGNISPSFNVNPRNGFLYMVFQTSQFRSDLLPQIGLMTSRDGGLTWSQAVQVSRTPANAPNPQAFTPFVAATHNGYVAVLYFDFRKDNKSDASRTKTNAWLAIYREVKDSTGGSTGIGLDFVCEKRLSRCSYIAQNGPVTAQGVMTDGDYAFLAAEAERFYAIYTKSAKGPFKPSIPILNDPSTQSLLLLNDNYRQAPFVSIIDSCSCIHK
jgi:hypothetical protein